MVIGLNDYEFQLNTSGVRLNTTSSAPFVDITKVSGLDNAPYRETIRDHEGADGSFIDAEFEKGRDVILEGTIYGDLTNVENYLDSLKANYAPVQTPIPFYFKPGTTEERLLFVKPRGIRYDWEAIRRLGLSSAQFMLYAEDPRIYSNNLINTVINYGGDAGFGLGFVTLLDTFTRTTSSSLGTADTGHTYTLTGTAADFSTNGTTAQITLTAATGTAYYALSNLTAVRNNHMYAQGVAISATPTGGTISQYFDSHYEDANNYYRAELIWTTSNTVQVALSKVVAATPTTIAAATTVAGLTSASSISIRVSLNNGQFGNGPNLLRAKVWATGTAEPATWNVEAGDSSLTGNGQTRIGAVRNSGNTNTNPIVSWSQLEVDEGFGFNIDFGGGASPAGGNFTNSGNRTTPVTFIITGPIINPVIFNNTTSDAMAFSIALAATETLTINTRDRTVYFGGSINRRAIMTTNEWIMLQPGVNNISFGGQTGGGSTLTIQYRSAWR